MAKSLQLGAWYKILGTNKVHNAVEGRKKGGRAQRGTLPKVGRYLVPYLVVGASSAVLSTSTRTLSTLRVRHSDKAVRTCNNHDQDGRLHCRATAELSVCLSFLENSP